MTTYYEKLKSPQWQKKRLEILASRGFYCESCCDETEQLHVHHKIYKKGLNPWDYPDYNYAVLCDTCHKEAHKTIDAMNELIGTLPIDGNFSQQGVLSFLMKFLYCDDEWIRATEKQYEKFKSLESEFEIPSENLMSSIGVVSGVSIPVSGKKIDFMRNMNNLDLSNDQLADIFSYIALNCSNVHPDVINAVRRILGCEDI